MDVRWFQNYQHFLLKGQIFSWLIFSFLFIFLPWTVFKQNINKVKLILYDIEHELKYTKAFELIAKLERYQDTDLIIKETLALFTKKANNLLKNEAITQIQQLVPIERLFFKIFPQNSMLVWFNANNRFLRITGSNSPIGGRAWQTIYDSITPECRPTQVTIDRANKMIANLMGQIASTQILTKAYKRPIKLLFRKRIHSFYICRFRANGNNKKHLGTLIILIPMDKAKKGWEFTHAVTKIRSSENLPNVKLGAMWVYSHQTLPGSEIDINLMEGLRSAFMNGSHTIVLPDGNFFLSKFLKKDPDVFFTVNILSNSENNINWLKFIRFSENIVNFLAITFTIISLLWWIGVLEFATSVKMRFHLTVVSLVGLPFITLVCFGAIGILEMHQFRLAAIEAKLADLMIRLEQTISNELASIEKLLQKTFEDTDFWENSTEDDRKSFFSNFQKNYGLFSFVFMPKNQPYKAYIASNRDHIPTHVFMNFIIDHFKFGKLPEKTQKEKKILIEDLGKQLKETRIDAFLNRFLLFTTDFFSNHIFQTFVLSKSHERSIYISMFFVSYMLRDYICKRTIDRFPGSYGLGADQVILKPIGTSKFKFFGKSHEKVYELLELVEYTDKPLRTSFSTNKRQFDIFIRKLKGTDAIGAIILPVQTNEKLQISMLIIFVLSGFLGAIGAWVGQTLLRKFFLTPLVKLQHAVSQIDQGIYSVRIKGVCTDELGTLSKSLNDLAQGLEEKQRMTPFLSQDLVSKVDNIIAGHVQRCEVTILFAGLRNFSLLEEQLSPRAAMALMSNFLSICDSAVKQHNGNIDKYIGDTAMGVFLSEKNGENSQIRAVKAALEISELASKLMKEREKLQLPVCRFGIGIASGIAVTGNIGSFKKRLDYTVIGDPVNLAARLEKLAGRDKYGHILVTSEVFEKLNGLFQGDLSDITSVKGKKTQIKIISIRVNSR